MVFLLDQDEDSYFPCVVSMHMSITTQIGSSQTSSMLPSPLPILASVSLRWLYLLLYNEHINHIQVFGFPPFPYPSHAQSPLSVWPMSNDITTFVLGL
jgi:hypothetical protein